MVSDVLQFLRLLMELVEVGDCIRARRIIFFCQVFLHSLRLRSSFSVKAGHHSGKSMHLVSKSVEAVSRLIPYVSLPGHTLSPPTSFQFSSADKL